MADRQYLTQIGRPSIDKAFDGLRTVTRVFEVNAEGSKYANIETEVFRAYATADDEFPLALLVKRGMQPASNNKNAYVLQLTEVYQEFTDSTKVNVGEDQLIKGEDGRTSIAKSFVCLASQAEALATAIGTVDTGRACSNVQINKHGVGAEIIETYISAGKLAETNTSDDLGALLTKTLTYYNQVPPTPSGYVLVRDSTSNTNGVPTYTYTFAKGEGFVAQSISARQDGLREVTYISLGTRIAPAGIVIRDDLRYDNAYTIYTVTTMQTAAGGSTPTTAAISFERWVPFTYPGRAKAFTEAYDSKTFLSCFLSPPVSTLVKATVAITYQTSNALGTISNFWNPSDWATVKKQWVGSYGRVSSQIESIPGYRSVSATPVTLAGGATTAIDGGIIYSGTTARITVTGGPADPGATTLTLHADIEPAFTDVAGTVYYRKTLVTAAIPAQAALPV